MPTEPFKHSARYNLGNMLQDQLKGVDYLFIGDTHTKNTTIAFVARPDVMNAFAASGVTDIDLEMLTPELVRIAELYHDDDISKDTMEFLVTDVFAKESIYKDDIDAKMKDIASIIDQAKTLNIEISSSNHLFPELSEEEFQIKYAHAVPLIEYQARAIDKVEGFSDLKHLEKAGYYHQFRREFNEKNPDLYAQSLTVKQMQEERLSALVKKVEAEMAGLSFSDKARGELEKFLVDLGEKGDFTLGDFEAMSKEAQQLTQKVFSYSRVKRRLENDPVAAQDIQDERNENGKLVSVYGALHFDRVSGDIDASIKDGKTATIRVYADDELSSLAQRYNQVQSLYGFDTSQIPDATIDVSKGTWTNASGEKTMMDMTLPSDEETLSVEGALIIPQNGTNMDVGAKQ